MRKTVWMTAAMLGLCSLPAAAADGDTLDSSSNHVPWARWQGRLSLGSSAPSSLALGTATTQKFASASLMGDYYFGRSLAGPGRPGGFRATSGLIIGPRALLSTGQPSLAAGNAFSIGSRLFGQNALPYANDTAETATLPYLGVGYTGLSARNRWSFSADLGLIAQSPGGLKVIRSQSLDDAVREMRLAPLLQLGVSYAF